MINFETFYFLKIIWAILRNLCVIAQGQSWNEKHNFGNLDRKNWLDYMIENLILRKIKVDIVKNIKNVIKDKLNYLPL